MQIWLSRFFNVFFLVLWNYLGSRVVNLSSNDLILVRITLREKCPNTEFHLVCIFPHSYWIRRDTRISPYSVRMRENTDQKKLRIWTLSRSVNFRIDQFLWWLAFAYNIFEEFAESSYVNQTKKQKIHAKINLFKILHKTSFSKCSCNFL